MPDRRSTALDHPTGLPAFAVVLRWAGAGRSARPTVSAPNDAFDCGCWIGDRPLWTTLHAVSSTVFVNFIWRNCFGALAKNEISSIKHLHHVPYCVFSWSGDAPPEVAWLKSPGWLAVACGASSRFVGESRWRVSAAARCRADSPWSSCWWSSRLSASLSPCCSPRSNPHARQRGEPRAPITSSRSVWPCTTTTTRSGGFRSGGTTAGADGPCTSSPLPSSARSTTRSTSRRTGRVTGAAGRPTRRPVRR